MRSLFLSLILILAGPLLKGAPTRVLLLHSYHQSFSWTARIHESVVQALQRSDPGIDIRTEYLDWKHFPRPDMLEHLRGHLREKYANLPFDLVLVSDNAATEFAVAHRSELFGKAPIVFCGYNGYPVGRFGPDSGVTGVTERVDAAGTLATALRMHRGIRRVLLVCDGTESGRAIRAELAQALPSLAHGELPELIDVPSLPTTDLVARLASEPPSTLILVCLFTDDGHGRALDLWELPDLLQRAGAHAPVWGLYEEALGHGIVGGKLQSGQRQGEMAAGLALRILKGEPLSRIPVVDLPTVRLAFDYREMARFGLDEADIPGQGAVLFAPDSFYTRHRRVVLGSLALLVMAVAALGGVLVMRVGRERALRASEARLRGLVQHMPLLTMALDASGRLVLWNRACVETTGMEVDAGETPEALARIFPDEGTRKAFLDMVTGATGDTERELPLRGRQGATRIIRWFSPLERFAIPGWSGWLVGVDVTARREAESQRLRLSLAMDQTQDGILLADREGQVTYGNPAAAAILGLPLASLQGRFVPDLFPMEEEPDLMLHRWAESVAGRAWSGRVTLLRPDGARRILGLSCFGVWEEGQLVGTSVGLHDLTEALALEEQVARTQRMDSLGALAAGVAHDFRNLMSAALGITQMVEEDDPASAARHANQLRQVLTRGTELVESLLGFARTRPATLEPVPVAILFAELDALVRHALPPSVTLTLAPGEGGLQVRGDQGQLLQVLLNLALNARDAMPQGGRLQVSARAASDRICLVVADNGSGMPPEVKARVFEPLFTTKPEGQGTGMGLAMAYRLVCSHGGDIEVESEVGVGTTFRIWLPRA